MDRESRTSARSNNARRPARRPLRGPGSRSPSKTSGSVVWTKREQGPVERPRGASPRSRSGRAVGSRARSSAFSVGLSRKASKLAGQGPDLAEPARPRRPPGAGASGSASGSATSRGDQTTRPLVAGRPAVVRGERLELVDDQDSLGRSPSARTSAATSGRPRSVQTNRTPSSVLRSGLRPPEDRLASAAGTAGPARRAGANLDPSPRRRARTRPPAPACLDPGPSLARDESRLRTARASEPRIRDLRVVCELSRGSSIAPPAARASGATPCR